MSFFHTNLLRLMMILIMFIPSASEGYTQESLQKFKELPTEIQDELLVPIPLGNIIQPRFGLQREDWRSESGADYYQKRLRLPFQTTTERSHFAYQFESDDNNTLRIKFKSQSSTARMVLLNAEHQILTSLQRQEHTEVQLKGDLESNTPQSYYLAVWDTAPPSQIVVEITLVRRKQRFDKEIETFALGETVDAEFEDGGRLLFSTGSQFSEDLDLGIISKDLRGEFKNNIISLSDNVTVSVKDKHSKWLITDKDNRQTYLIRRKGDGIDIYGGGIYKLYSIQLPQRGIFEVSFPIVDQSQPRFRVELSSQDQERIFPGPRIVIEYPGTYILKIDTIEGIDPTEESTPFQIRATFEAELWRVHSVEEVSGLPY